MDAPKLPKDNAFGIDFSTSPVKSTGLLTYVKVTLELATLAPTERVFINLCEHPLYPQLVNYVRINQG